MNGGRKTAGPGRKTPFLARSRSFTQPNDTGTAGVTSRTNSTIPRATRALLWLHDQRCGLIAWYHTRRDQPWQDRPAKRRTP